MLYQRAGLTLDIPFSEKLLDVSKLPPVAPSAPDEDELLALTDESGADAQPASAESGPDEASLAQGLEQVQQYEEQQRQDLAAEQASEVLEPIIPNAEAEPVAQEVVQTSEPAATPEKAQ